MINLPFQISDGAFIIISKELNVKGNVCQILDKYFNYTNKDRKTIKNEYDSQYKDYRDIKQEEGTYYINNKHSKLIKHNKITKNKS